MTLLLDTQVALWWLTGSRRLAPMRAGVSILPIHDEHAIVGAELSPRYADPFDRLLLATALVDRTPLATADAALIDAAEQDPTLPIFAVR